MCERQDEGFCCPPLSLSLLFHLIPVERAPGWEIPLLQHLASAQSGTCWLQCWFSMAVGRHKLYFLPEGQHVPLKSQTIQNLELAAHQTSSN